MEWKEVRAAPFSRRTQWELAPAFGDAYYHELQPTTRAMIVTPTQMYAQAKGGTFLACISAIAAIVAILTV
jgi:hypothetical protein